MLGTVKKTRIRWMREGEAWRVAEISQTVFRPVDAWTLDEVLDFAEIPSCYPKVLLAKKKILGGVFYTVHHHIVQIRHLLVEPTAWRRGLGRRLVEHVIDQLPELRRRIILIEVPERHMAGQCLMRSCKFDCFRTTQHSNDPEDYYAMRYIGKGRRR